MGPQGLLDLRGDGVGQLQWLLPEAVHLRDAAAPVVSSLTGGCLWVCTSVPGHPCLVRLGPRGRPILVRAFLQPTDTGCSLASVKPGNKAAHLTGTAAACTGLSTRGGYVGARKHVGKLPIVILDL